MSTEAIADHAAKLTRALRLEDVLINAGAVPLPVDLTPSMIPQDNAGNGATLPPDSDSRSAADDHGQAQVQPPPRATIGAGTPDGTATEDAVVKGLQAARDAIHDSLRHDVGAHSGDAAQSIGPIASEAVQDLSSPATHDAVSMPTPGSIGDIGASDSAHAASLTNFDLANVVSTLPTDQTAAADPSSLEHVAGSGVGTVLAQVGAVESTASNVLHDAQPVVNGLPTAIESTVPNIMNSAANPTDLLMPLLTGVGTPPATPPVPATVADAVTVPSLHGVGFDALAGLLQPSSAAPEAAHAQANPVHGLEDLSIGAPIGAEDLIHSDSSAAHAAHSALPHVGSGLI
jgi:hypothetical protein